MRRVGKTRKAVVILSACGLFIASAFEDATGVRKRPEPLTVEVLTPGKAPGELLAAATKLVFSSGDRFRIRIASASAGLLYLIVHESGGDVRVLHASRLLAGRTTSLPPGSWYSFDQEPGLERLFVLFARSPIPLMESQRVNGEGFGEFEDLVRSGGMTGLVDRSGASVYVHTLTFTHLPSPARY